MLFEGEGSALDREAAELHKQQLHRDYQHDDEEVDPVPVDALEDVVLYSSANVPSSLIRLQFSRLNTCRKTNVWNTIV